MRGQRGGHLQRLAPAQPDCKANKSPSFRSPGWTLQLPPMSRSERFAALPSPASKPPTQPARPRASRSPGPGTLPAPGEQRPSLAPGALTRRREPAIIVAPATQLQEARAVLLLAGVPMAEPGARTGAQGTRPPGCWSRRLLLPSAASTAASRAGSPSTSKTPCALRQPGSRAEEGGGQGGSGGRSAPAQRRGRPGRERQPRLHPTPPGALLQQRLRRTREEGWAREGKGTTSHSEASSHCQPPPPLPRPAGEGLSRVAAER